MEKCSIRIFYREGYAETYIDVYNLQIEKDFVYFETDEEEVTIEANDITHIKIEWGCD